MNWTFDAPSPKKQSLQVFVDQLLAARWTGTNERARQVGSLIEQALAEKAVPDFGETRETEQRLHAKISLTAFDAIRTLSVTSGQSPQDVGTALIRAILPRILVEHRAADEQAERENARRLERERAIEDRAHEIETAEKSRFITTHERGDRIEISMPFSEAAKALVKAIPGAQWNSEDRVWHISKRYEKRFTEALPLIRGTIAREWAEHEIEHDELKPAALDEVKLSFERGFVFISFRYDESAIKYIRPFKREGTLIWDPQKSSWKANWKNREWAYRIATAVNEILS
jgi:hypothetical protein